jgi:hypothetical protein
MREALEPSLGKMKRSARWRNAKTKITAPAVIRSNGNISGGNSMSLEKSWARSCAVIVSRILSTADAKIF